MFNILSFSDQVCGSNKRKKVFMKERYLKEVTIFDYFYQP